MNTNTLYTQLPSLASRLGNTSYVDPNANPMHLLLDYNSSMVTFNDKLAFLANSEHLNVRQELGVIHNLISLHTRAISEWLDQRFPLEPLVREPPTKKPRLVSSVPNLPPMQEPQGPFTFPNIPEVSLPLPNPPLDLTRTESVLGPSRHRFLEGLLSPNHESDLMHSISQPTVEDVIDLTADTDDEVETTFLDTVVDTVYDDFDLDLSFLDE